MDPEAFADGSSASEADLTLDTDNDTTAYLVEQRIRNIERLGLWQDESLSITQFYDIDNEPADVMRMTLIPDRIPLRSDGNDSLSSVDSVDQPIDSVNQGVQGMPQRFAPGVYLSSSSSLSSTSSSAPSPTRDRPAESIQAGTTQTGMTQTGSTPTEPTLGSCVRLALPPLYPFPQQSPGHANRDDPNAHSATSASPTIQRKVPGRVGLGLLLQSRRLPTPPPRFGYHTPPPWQPCPRDPSAPSLFNRPHQRLPMRHHNTSQNIDMGESELDPMRDFENRVDEDERQPAGMVGDQEMHNGQVEENQGGQDMTSGHVEENQAGQEMLSGQVEENQDGQGQSLSVVLREDVIVNLLYAAIDADTRDA